MTCWAYFTNQTHIFEETVNKTLFIRLFHATQTVQSDFMVDEMIYEWNKTIISSNFLKNWEKSMEKSDVSVAYLWCFVGADNTISHFVDHI